MRYKNKPVDWSQRNNQLFCDIFTSAQTNPCATCTSASHSTKACPYQLEVNSNSSQHNPQQFTPKPSTARQVKSGPTDSYGRHIIFHRPVCNNYNSENGCTSPRCHNIHVCSNCKKPHSKTTCHMTKNFQDQRHRNHYS